MSKPVIKTLKVMFGSVEIRTVYVGAKQVNARHFLGDIVMPEILGQGSNNISVEQ